MIARAYVHAVTLAAAFMVVLGGTACSAAGKTDASAPVGAAVRAPDVFRVGREATALEIAAWDRDVNAKGEGLPPGEGTVAQGAVVYAKTCASCHGPAGEGIAPNPKLVGRIPGDSFPFATDREAKTIGNYWPYATTLFDYIRRAMPQNALGSLSDNDTYAVIAWLLATNKVIAADAVMNAKTLPAVQMPSRNRFVRDDRTGGAGFK